MYIYIYIFIKGSKHVFVVARVPTKFLSARDASLQVAFPVFVHYNVSPRKCVLITLKVAFISSGDLFLLCASLCSAACGTME